MTNKKKNTTQAEKTFETLKRKYATEGEISRERLVALRDGDEDAYREVYLRFVEPLVNYLKIQTKSLEQSQDLAQEILANLWIKRERIDPDKSIKGFLFTVARQTAIDYRRRDKVRKIYPASDWLPEEMDEVEADDYIIARETELLVKLALNAMPPQRRRIFELSHNEELDNEEIARQLGISKTSVEKQISYARRELRELLKLVILLFISQ